MPYLVLRDTLTGKIQVNHMGCERISPEMSDVKLKDFRQGSDAYCIGDPSK